MKPKKLKLRQRIRISLIFNFPKLYWWSSDRKQKRLRRKYCHKGIHKLRRSMEGYRDDSGQKYFHFYTCHFCNYSFFHTERELKRYKKFKGKWDEDQKAWLKKISALSKHPLEPKSKQIVGSGRCNSGEVSTRKSSGERWFTW